MVKFKGFKAEVFITIPLTAMAFIMVCTSLISSQWVSGEIKNSNATDDQQNSISYNYGLFSGSKTRIRSGTLEFSLKIICADKSVCMMSCGQSKDNRQADLENILSNKPCSNLFSADAYFCNDEGGDAIDKCDYDPNPEPRDPRGSLMRYGTYVSTVFFLILALVFTLITAVFSFVNVCHTPVELIYGVQGLVAWNTIASLSYFLALCIWGGEFNKVLSEVAPISDLARPDAIGWENSTQSLGYSYWLIFVCFFLHAVNVGITVFYIYKKYKPRQTNREVGIDNDNSKGTAMLF